MCCCCCCCCGCFVVVFFFVVSVSDSRLLFYVFVLTFLCLFPLGIIRVVLFAVVVLFLLVRKARSRGGVSWSAASDVYKGKGLKG